MAKPKEPPKPLFPIKHEFYAALDNFAHQAGMLADAVRQALELDLIDKRVAPMLKERLDEFTTARFSDE